nr:hypothetical protein [Macromonas bipunctata]
MFRNDLTTPEPLPIKVSKSPSPSMSTNAGLAYEPVFAKPNGLVLDAAKAALLAVPVLRKNSVLPSLPTKASKSPSPSMSTKTGLAYEPTPVKPKALVLAAANAALLTVPVLRANQMSPVASPTKASRSPSPSTSTNATLARDSTVTKPKGLVLAAAKAALLAVPVFRKNSVLPSLLPTKASKSPSPSMSTSVGLALSPTSLRPKGLVLTTPKAALLTVPVLRKNSVLPSLLPTKASKSPSASMSTNTGLAESPTSVNPNGPVLAESAKKVRWAAISLSAM